MRATKKQKKQIAQLAKTLPALNWKERTNKIPVRGSELLEKTPDAKDTEGNPIESHKRYLVKVPRPVNHQKEMLRILEEKGEDEVKVYVEQMRQFNKTTPEQNDVPELHNE